VFALLSDVISIIIQNKAESTGQEIFSRDHFPSSFSAAGCVCGGGAGGVFAEAAGLCTSGRLVMHEESELQ